MQGPKSQTTDHQEKYKDQSKLPTRRVSWAKLFGSLAVREESIFLFGLCLLVIRIAHLFCNKSFHLIAYLPQFGHLAWQEVKIYSIYSLIVISPSIVGSTYFTFLILVGLFHIFNISSSPHCSH